MVLRVLREENAVAVAGRQRQAAFVGHCRFWDDALTPPLTGPHHAGRPSVVTELGWNGTAPRVRVLLPLSPLEVQQDAGRFQIQE